MRCGTPRELGAFIRARRRRCGLDQATLAERAGVSRLWIGQVERGKSGAPLGLILRTLAALDIELDLVERRATDAAGPVDIFQIVDSLKGPPA